MSVKKELTILLHVTFISKIHGLCYSPLVAKSANFESQNRVLLAKVVFSRDF